VRFYPRAVRRSVLVAILGVSAAWGTAPALAQTEGEVSLARKFYEDGLAAEKVGKWADALASYEKALAIKETPQILLRAGVCHENLGHVAKALVVLERAHEQAKLKHLDDVTTVIEERLTAVRPRVPLLLVDVPEPPAGIEVRLDGEPLAAAAFGSEVPVDPGEHTLTAAAPERANFEKKVKLAEAAHERVEVRLEPGQGSPLPPPPVPPGGEGEPMYVPGAVLLGVGAAAVIVGAVLVPLAQAKEADVDDRCGGPERLTCPLADKTEIEDELSQASSFRIAGFVVGAIGVAAVVTGVVLVIVPPTSEGGAAALRLAPGPTPWGLGLEGSF
jgi:hypothetical protein